MGAARSLVRSSPHAANEDDTHPLDLVLHGEHEADSELGLDRVEPLGLERRVPPFGELARAVTIEHPRDLRPAVAARNRRREHRVRVLVPDVWP